jgi:hypothetical protein
MRKITRTATALAILVSALVGCDADNTPLAPSPPPVVQQPPSTPSVYTLTSSASTVAPGAALSVSWTASEAAARDWIGLFKIGADHCDHGWSESTSGLTSGTLTLTAPSELGRYEFRYHLNNSCDEVARSSPVTVGGSS